MSTACDRHPAIEAARGYGHGSAKPGGRTFFNHPLDGPGPRFSDSQGIEIAPVEAKEHADHGNTEEHGAASAQ